MQGIGKILDPIGAFAPKSGFGRILSPVTAIANKVGGQAGDLIDPAGAIRGDRIKKAQEAQPRQASLLAEPDNSKFG